MSSVLFESTSDAARRLGVSARTIRRYYHRGLLPGYQVGSRIFIEKPVMNDSNDCVIYCRVSPGEPESVLDARVSALRDYASANGYHVTRVVTEVARGDLGSKKELLGLLCDSVNWGILLIEHPHVIARAEVSYGFVRELVESKGSVIVSVG